VYRLPDPAGIRIEARRTIEIDLSFLDFVVLVLSPAFY
jgi:hypothetical protein